MSITELVDQNQRPVEEILEKNDIVRRQTTDSEPLTVIGQVVQKESQETELEYESEKSVKDIIVSSIVVLCFIAFLFLVYYIHPS